MRKGQSWRLTTAAILLAVLAGPGVAAADAWFTPPPPPKNAPPTVDISHPSDSTEAVTIITKRPSRSWRTPPELGLTAAPHASDVDRRAWSNRSFTPESPYCNSSLRNVGGQPATAAETMVGSGAGAC